MSLISYAKNLEDVMLWRALQGVRRGFYIDIRAGSSEVYSATRAFYDRGWSGIHVEPNPERCAQLLKTQPRDRSLQIAVSDVSGQAQVYFFNDSGLSTFDPDIAQHYISRGWTATELSVPSQTLESICSAHVPDDQAVNFLKIDAEGGEDAVIRSADWHTTRPWIVVVRSTMPNSPIQFDLVWEGPLIDAGYEPVYSDGVNRFYLANEHSDKKPAFQYPPNMFDDYQTADFVLAQRQADEAVALAWQAKKNERAMRDELALLHRSLSWRLTEPARNTIDGVRWMLIRPIERVVAIFNGFRRRSVALLQRHPRAKRWVDAVCQTLPWIDRRLTQISLKADSSPSPAVPGGHGQDGRDFATEIDIIGSQEELSSLSPQARRIYADLKVAIRDANQDSAHAKDAPSSQQ